MIMIADMMVMTMLVEIKVEELMIMVVVLKTTER